MIDELRGHDAILLGAIGDPSVPSGLLERGLLLRMRFALDHHVNLRPSGCIPGCSSPLAGDPEIDFVVVREGTEGPYTGNGGAIRVGTPHEVATEVSVNTAFGVRAGGAGRVRPGAAAAQAPDAGAQDQRAGLRRAACGRAPCSRGRRPSIPDVEVAYQHIDAATIHMVTDPGRFDVIVTDNLFGDIITDLAAAVCGGIGLAASGNIDATRTQSVDVRAGARQCARHRRARGSPIRPRPSCRWRCCWRMSARIAAAARVDKAVEEHLATRGDASLSTSAGRRPDPGEAVGTGGGFASLTRQCWLFAIGSSFFALATAPGFPGWAGAGAAEHPVLRRLMVLHHRGMDAAGALRPGLALRTVHRPQCSSRGLCCSTSAPVPQCGRTR